MRGSGHKKGEKVGAITAIASQTRDPVNLLKFSENTSSVRILLSTGSTTGLSGLYVQRVL